MGKKLKRFNYLKSNLWNRHASAFALAELDSPRKGR
jgi:hypothetical protein